MYLSHYFESDILEAIKSDTLFNDSIEADLPELPVASLAYEKQLQLQEDRSFDMETAINRSKQDRKLYHWLSHYLYSKMLLSKTDPIVDWQIVVFNLRLTPSYERLLDHPILTPMLSVTLTNANGLRC